MSDACFDTETSGPVAHLILNRPHKRNSMIPAFWTELPARLQQLQQDGKVRVLVISARGPHFSSGMDLSVLTGSSSTDGTSRVGQDLSATDVGAERGTGTDTGTDTVTHSNTDTDTDTDGDGDTNSGTHTVDAQLAAHQRQIQQALRLRDLVTRLQRAFTALERARIPVLAAIQGGCIGGAVDMVSACDMRYATADAHFVIQETNLGMTADVGTFPRLCKLMPDGLVRELAFTGRALTAAEALQSGFINRLYDDHQAMIDGVLQLADEIAGKSPLAVHGCKQMILHARDHSVADTLDQVSLWNAAYLRQQEIMEAFQASQQGRAPRFTPLPPLLAEDDDDMVLP